MSGQTESFDAIKADFERHAIPTDQPGFYEHPAFVEQERSRADYLHRYARFVHELPRADGYDRLVRDRLPVIAGLFYERLKAQGRLGACVAVSQLLSRVLDAEGIWNFVVRGALSIEFREACGIPTKYFHSVGEGEHAAAHAWVIAPPYYVVDVSIRMQPYSCGEAQYLPPYLCSETARITSGTVEEIIFPEMRDHLASIGVQEDRMLAVARPHAGRFIRVIPARQVETADAVLRYTPVAPTMPEVPFEEMRTILFGGSSGYEFYREEIHGRFA